MTLQVVAPVPEERESWLAKEKKPFPQFQSHLLSHWLHKYTVRWSWGSRPHGKSIPGGVAYEQHRSPESWYRIFNRPRPLFSWNRQTRSSSPQKCSPERPIRRTSGAPTFQDRSSRKRDLGWYHKTIYNQRLRTLDFSSRSIHHKRSTMSRLDHLSKEAMSVGCFPKAASHFWGMVYKRFSIVWAKPTSSRSMPSVA